MPPALANHLAPAGATSIVPPPVNSPDANAFLDLASMLERRLEIIANHEFRNRDPEGHLDALKVVSEKIVGEQARLAAVTPPRLAHFLQGCSYDKALAFIEGMKGA